MDRLEAEHANLRAALTKPGNAEFALRLGSAIFWFWRVRQYVAEGLLFLKRTLGQASDAPHLLQARALRALGILLLDNGVLTEAETALQQSHHLFEVLGATSDASTIAANLGILAAYRGDLASARLAFNQAITFYRAQRDKPRLAMLLANQGAAILREEYSERFAEAHPLFEESLGLHQEIGDITGQLPLLYNLGEIAFEQGKILEAQTYLLESFRIALQYDLPVHYAQTLIFLAEILMVLQKPDILIVAILGRLGTILATGETPLARKDESKYNHFMLTLREKLGVSIYEATYETGARWSLEETLQNIERELD